MPTASRFLIQDIPYTLERERRRTITLSVSPSGSVTVKAPSWAPSFAIHSFVEGKLGWLRRALERLQKHYRPPLQLETGSTIPIWGVSLTLRIESTTNRSVSWGVTGHELVLSVPARQLSKATIRTALRRACSEAILARAKEMIPSIAKRLGVRPGPVSVGFAKYRWGSCHSSGKLRFNARLALMPPTMLEYVIVHELAHLKELNHSKRFWQIVSDLLPDHKARRTWMREHASYIAF